MEFRHFHETERDAIDWADKRIALIELGEGFQYSNQLAEKLAILKAAEHVLVAWPGKDRQDIFELDDETREFAIKELSK